MESTRKLLKPADLPDNFVCALYKVAPYRGCAHACRYCDGRAERYYFEGDYEKDIKSRTDIPMRLADELPSLRERGLIAFGSGTTDPYQPIEAGLQITGQCSRHIAEAESKLPALVMTKSSLVLRDLENWKRVNERSGFVLLVSIMSLDESLREAMESGASSFAARLDALAKFKAAGCTVGVLAMPFLPGLSDSEESIRNVYEASFRIGADFVMPGGLTLRPGRQKDCYLDTLGRMRPDLLPGLSRDYWPERLSGMPNQAALAALKKRINSVRQDYSLPFLLPHKIFARLMPSHDALRVLFRDMIELYKERGADVGPLFASAEHYDQWLIGLRRHYRRRRQLPKDWIEERLLEAERTGELASVLGNERLLRFTRAVLIEGARLNYLSLKLE